MLRAVDLFKSYGDVQALCGANLTVEAGQIVSLLGRNGAGKSTLLSIVSGLLAPDRGRVEIGGVDVHAQPGRAAKLLGLAPQHTGVYTVLTVRENLEFFAELAGLKRAESRLRAREVGEQLGLTRQLDRKAAALSGGQARRLHTGCALVHRPRLLMLDEPTVGADVDTRNQLIAAVRTLAAEGAAVVYTTHYLPEVEALEADIVIIDAGRVMARGTRAQLVADHQLRGVQLTFDGEFPRERFADFAPAALGRRAHRLVGDIDMAGVLRRLGEQAERLISVEVLKPDLETVYLAVTGQRLAAEQL
jgi:ABC-2 type transport system ATP-binding protein